MAWNRPLNDAAKAKSRSEQRSVRRFRVLIGGAILGVLAIGAWLLFFSSISSQAPKGSQLSKQISAAEQRNRLRQIVEKKTGKEFKVTEAPKKPTEPEFYTNKLGEVKRRTGRSNVFGPGPSRSLFASPAEDQISTVVNTPLGGDIFDEDVPEDFEDQFAYSLTNRIVITESDTPETAEKKQRVIDAKEKLVELKKQGVDLRQALIEEKRSLIRRFEDYRFFDQGLTELRRKNATPNEIAEYALAAKKMMEAQQLEMGLNLDTDEEDAMKRLDALVKGKDPDEEGEEQ